MSTRSVRHDVSPEHLQNTLGAVAEIMGAWDVVLSSLDLNTSRFGRQPVSSNAAHLALQRWPEFVCETPWLSDHRWLAEARSMINTDNLLDPEELLKTSFYRNCLKPHGIGSGLIMVIDRSRDEMTWLHLLRAGEGSAFGPDDMSLLYRLQPLLAQTIRLAQDLADIEAMHDSMVDTIDHVPAGVMILHGGRFICNQRAKTTLAENDGLQLVGGQLKAGGDQQAALQKLIDDAKDGVSGALAIRRPSGKFAFDVTVHAVGRVSDCQARERSAVAVYVADPSHERPTSTAYLRQAFDLTRSEADIATFLANGQSPAEIAGKLGITVDTVRGHIKNILTKTRTSRQAELVALIANRPIS